MPAFFVLASFIFFLQTANAQCTIDAIATNTTQPPIFNSTTSSFINNMLTVGFDWGITATRLDSPTVLIGSCPVNPVVGAFESSCYISETVTYNFTELTGSCGWTQLSTGASLIYGGPMYLYSNETFVDSRGVNITRNLAYTIEVSVSFPAYAAATTSVQIFSSVVLDVFVTSQIYLASTGKATVTFETVVGYPFEIIIASANAAVISGTTPTTGFTTTIVNTSTSSLGTTPGSTSTQVWDLIITPDVAACTFTGVYDLTPVFTIICVLANQSDCPPINNNTVDVSLSIASEDYCAQITSFVPVTATLQSYKDFAQTTAATNFLTNDFQTAYFEMVVTSSAVTITNLSIQTIVLLTSGNFLRSAGSTTNAVNLYSNNVWNNPNVSGVLGSGLGGQQKFQFDINSNLFAVTRDTSATVAIAVNGSINYLGGKKRAVSSVFQVPKVQTTLVQQNVFVGSNSGFKTRISLSCALAMVMALFLF